MDLLLSNAISEIPAGRWAVGVSGGADSVALCDLARQRSDLQLHMVHLDHELRGPESSGDAAFVTELAHTWRLPLTLERRSLLEARYPEALPSNPQGRYRTLRLHLFRQVVQQHALHGVLLAHHADDQAETILLRLVRGSGVQGLAGIPRDSRLGDLRLFRPLLEVPRQQLRIHLRQAALTWREDSSNDSAHYLRNRVRQYLRGNPSLTPSLLAVSRLAGEMGQWLSQRRPPLTDELRLESLRPLPRILLRDALRCWLLRRGVPANEISLPLLDRVMGIATDAAAPARINLPGNLRLHRQRGRLTILQ